MEIDTTLDDGTLNHWNIQSLLPVDWLVQANAYEGGFVLPPIDFEELGVPEGLEAKIVSIQPIPEIEDGPGRVVLTTIDRLAGNVYELSLTNTSGSVDTLGVTGIHRFYSEERGWVHAEDLVPGEVVRGSSGPLTVSEVRWTPAEERVYNFTVESDHVYYVGDLSALTHNVCRTIRYGPGYSIRIDPAVPGRPHPRWSIDTSTFTSGTKTQGNGIRNPRQFWKQWAAKNPATLSPYNKDRIANGLSPEIDKIWIKSFPEHSSFNGSALVHHHVQQGKYAIPIPKAIHRGKEAEWH